MCVQNVKFIALPIHEIIGVLQKLGQSLDTPTLPFLPNFSWAFVRMDPVSVPPNLKFVALPVPEILGCTQKWAVPGYTHAPFSPTFSWAFVRMDPVNIPAWFEVRSFSRSWDNRRYSKNLCSLWIHPRFLFSQIFHELLFGWTLLMYLPNFKFVALLVPEIIKVIKKFGQSLDTPCTLFFPKFLMGFCLDGPCEWKFAVRSFTHSWDNSDCSFTLGLRTPILEKGRP